jgi:CCR4-NOT transcription complex subunit 3
MKEKAELDMKKEIKKL